MSSFGVIDQSLAYVEPLVALVPGAREKLPPLKGFTEVAGRIREGLPGAGIPLATATMDAWSGMIGAGVSGEGDAVYLSGTSEVVGIVSSRRVPTPGVIAFPECEGIVVHAGPTQAGGASVAWMARLLGRSPDGISELVAASDPELPTPIFLPHLQGERAPLWDPAARASFSGVDGSMGPAELSRAVMEGVAYSVRLLMDSLEHSAGLSVDTLTHSGGGARSDIWCQIRADVLGRALKRTANTDSGVLGAAIFAGVSSGLYASIGEASKALVAVERVFEPNPHRRARHDEGFARYVDLYTRLKGFG
jgi:xylulokinase